MIEIRDITTTPPLRMQKVSYCACKFEIDPLSRHTYVTKLPKKLLHAVPKRRSEFLAGRFCAALALEQLIEQSVDIQMHADGSPMWPSGIVGSITHSQKQAAAIVGLKRSFWGLGIDCEHIVDEQQARLISGSVLSSADRNFFSFGMMPFNRFITLVFSAKEALFKATFPTTQELLDFSEVDVLSLEATRIRLTTSRGRLLRENGVGFFTVDYVFSGDHVVTFLALPKRGEA